MIGVILAGGQSSRMDGADKALLDLGDRRLIDIVHDRLSPQVDHLVLSGSNDRGTDLPLVDDAADIEGPVGGLYGVVDWLQSRDENAVGFLTVPVDAPFLPMDLVSRLSSDPYRCAYANDEHRGHPTLAYWTLGGLQNVRGSLGTSPPLMRVVDAVGARPMTWDDPTVFFNVNTKEQAQEAERRLACSQS